MLTDGDDLHICGKCKEVYSDVQTFIDHKFECKKNTDNNIHDNVEIDTSKTSKHGSKGHRAVRSKANVSKGNALTNENEMIINDELFPNEQTNDDDDDDAKDVKGIVNDEQQNESIILDKDDDNDDDDSLYEMLTKKEKIIPGIHKLTTNTGSDIFYSHQMSDNGRKYKCEFNSLCHFATHYLKDLERHYRIHTGEKPYTCTRCGKSFNRSDKLKLHMRAHTGEKPYKCEECSYASSDRSSLVKHIRTHTDERPFKCQICPYASRNSSQLVVHLRTHTGDAPFRCSKCTAAFKINSDLKRHMRMHSGEKPFVCSQCNYRSAIKGNLKNHMKLNHSGDRHVCDQCDYVASSRKLLKEHTREHDTKALRCVYCSYTTASRSALNNHIRIHTNEKPYECTICGYSCRQACNLRTHIKKKHPDYEIDSVKKRRKQKEHKYITESKSSPRVKGRALCQTLFPCHLCECSFVREDSLRSHIRHHQEIPQQSTGAALAILQLQHNANANCDVIDHSDELIDTQPEDAEFEISTSEINSQDNRMSAIENTIAVESHLYHKLMENDTIEHETNNTVTKRGRPIKKTQLEVSQHKDVSSHSQQRLRILATQTSSGQIIYQLPPGMRVIPVSAVNQTNNTVLIIDNQSISTTESIISDV